MTDETGAHVAADAKWAAIARALRDELAVALYARGQKLPTEADLARRFGVNRHTVRRAIASLAEAGLVHARRGAGVFVVARPTEYPLGRRVRFHQNLAAAGQTAERRITRLETRRPTGTEAEALGSDPDAMVHVVEGVSLADGQPIALFRSVFPAARFPDLLAEVSKHSSLTAALAACGLADYTRAGTRLTAMLSDPIQAAALQIQTGAPVLRSVAVNVDAVGVPVEFGTTWFAGDRVTLTVNPDQA